MKAVRSIANLQDDVRSKFVALFGRTPLRERLDDVLREAIELNRFTDMSNLREEVGDLLSTTIQLCNENGWNIDDVVKETLIKIDGRKLQYLSLGRKINVAVLGGAFDPITTGHVKLAQFVLNSSKTFDEIWIMPCFNHMYNKSMASAYDRLEMCKLAVAIDGRIQVSDYEIKNALRGETYHLVKRLLNEDYAKNRYDFSFIIGLDNANTFNKWVNYEELERMCRFVVVPRKGIARDESVNWYLKQPHIYLSPDNDIPEISSTEIRTWLKDHKEPKEPISDVPFLDKNVLDYIIKNRLYKR